MTVGVGRAFERWLSLFSARYPDSVALFENNYWNEKNSAIAD